MLGEKYKGYKRSTNTGIVSYGIDRDCRALGDSCKSKVCEKSKLYCCNQITDTERKGIFSKFWKHMTWDQKKVYVTALVDYAPTKRSSTASPSRRKGSYYYHLKVDKTKRRVCKKTFLSTLGLREDMVHDWIKKSNHGILKSTDNRNHDRKRYSNQVMNVRKEKLQQWLKSLPNQPSHYCRKDSSKHYLEQLFHSKADVYREYKRMCSDNNDVCLSKSLFEKFFSELNYAIYVPRKDRCDLCCAYEAGNVEEEKYREHIKRKDRAREEKTKDKEDAIQNKNYTFTMDLQAAQICPSLNASALYYKLKLSVHNFTMYNLATHKCVNFWWNETEGDLSASTFANFILDHISQTCTAKTIPIFLYSDGCCYQNRNCILSNALLHYAIKNNTVIEQKFLEKGHTNMECDAVHSLIERKIKKRPISLPSDYVQLTIEARTKPCPLEARYITHDYFKNYAKRETFIYESIRPGRKTNDPTVTDLRVLRYDPKEKKIFFKLHFDDDFQELPVRAKYSMQDVTYPPLHSERIKIKEQKWKHLQELRLVLSSDCHAFYNNLPH